VVEHVGGVLRARTHWVLVADRPNTLTLLSLFAALRLRGLGADALAYGTVPVLCPATREQGVVTFLTVPKDLLPASDLNAYLAEVATGGSMEEVADVPPPRADPVAADVVLLAVHGRDHILERAVGACWHGQPQVHAN
jgi:hypothetical protein